MTISEFKKTFKQISLVNHSYEETEIKYQKVCRFLSDYFTDDSIKLTEADLINILVEFVKMKNKEE